MSMEVETVVAISVMMAVFSAVAAIGTSIVLGAGFERLRAGFEVVRKQTGFFSDAIHKLEQKVEVVDKQTGAFSQAIAQMQGKVDNVGDQANAFSESIQNLERKVDVVDKQTGFFGDAIHKLNRKIDTLDAHEEIVSEKMARHADADFISTAKTEALVSHAEDLLNQMSVLAGQMKDGTVRTPVVSSDMHLSIPQNMSGGSEMRYH
ncbi:MAG: hypothetical protein KDI13_02050 [Alphaproteobacteria bacterium]|nr:hypothetical protein [Alphaproteobacteria bacterium]